MLKYKNKGHKLGGFNCVTMDENDHDKCLSGRYGKIWEIAPGKYKGFIVKKVGSDWEERLFDVDDLKRWKDELEVPFNADMQLGWANDPNSRHV